MTHELTAATTSLIEAWSSTLLVPDAVAAATSINTGWPLLGRLVRDTSQLGGTPALYGFKG